MNTFILISAILFWICIAFSASALIWGARNAIKDENDAVYREALRNAQNALYESKNEITKNTDIS